MKQKQFKRAVLKIKKHARPIGARIARVISKTSLPEIAFVSCLIFSKYLRNADFQYPGEIIVPIFLFAVIVTFAFYAYRLILRSWLGARIASLMLVYALYSFNYLPNWIKNSGKILLPKHFETTWSGATLTALIIAIAAGALAYGLTWLAKNITVIRHLQLHRIILFALLFIFVIQGFKVTTKWVAIHDQLTYKYQLPAYERDPNATISKPDIYYFVFDRYANSEVLKANFNYDNSGLTDYLSGQGFVNRLDSKANYPFTMESVSSTMGMKYHADLEELFGSDNLHTAFPYRSILSNPPIAQVLKQNGYNYNQVSSWWDFTRVGIKSDDSPTISFRLRMFGRSFFMSDLSRDIINKSILSQWLKKGTTVGSHAVIKYDLDNSPRDNFFAQKAAIKKLASAQSAQPQFTFAHFLAPHDPYIFTAEGANPAYDGGRNDNGEDEPIKYTNEMTYINTQIKDMMGYIREHSPNAVIIIQADEGPYPKQFRFELSPKKYYNPVDLPLAQEQQKYSNLASYYMPGVDEATVRENITSSVNPFRFVLKNYLGYKMEMLPDCQFSTGNKFMIYRYENETPKLQTSPSAACEKL